MQPHTLALCPRAIPINTPTQHKYAAKRWHGAGPSAPNDCSKFQLRFVGTLVHRKSAVRRANINFDQKNINGRIIEE